MRRQRGYSTPNSFAPSLAQQFESSSSFRLQEVLDDTVSWFKKHGTRMHFRSLQLIAAAAFSCLLIWLSTSWISGGNPVPLSTASITTTEAAKPTQLPNAGDEAPFYDIPHTGELLGHKGIKNIKNPQIQLAKVHITVDVDPTVTPAKLSTATMEAIPIKLPKQIDIPLRADDLAGPAPEPQIASTTLTSAPLFDRASLNASHVLIGVATTYERLEQSLEQISHWAGNSEMRIIASMEPTVADTKIEDRVITKAKALNIPIVTIDSSLPFLDRYFHLTKLLHENKNAHTKWYGLIDDDTFFPSLRTLLATLNKYPDPGDESYYVGGLSEDYLQMSQWGVMAYGGAGVFLSSHLMDEIMSHFKDCFAPYDTGDRKLMRCIYKYTTTKLSWEHGMHQMDLHGNQAGFYEALRAQPISVHHFKGGDFMSEIDVFALSRVSLVCGDECILKKYKFKDGWVLTNGFSLVKYSDADTRYRKIETDISMERTWAYMNGGEERHFAHSLGPLRNADPGKISYRMESAIVEDDGSVRQLYVKRSKEVGVEAAVEITWSRKV